MDPCWFDETTRRSQEYRIVFLYNIVWIRYKPPPKKAPMSKRGGDMQEVDMTISEGKPDALPVFSSPDALPVPDATLKPGYGYAGGKQRQTGKAMPKGWDKFKDMVDKLLESPIEYFATSAPCSIHPGGKCIPTCCGTGIRTRGWQYIKGIVNVV